MKSRVWQIPESESNHCCFQCSVLLFEKPVTEEEMNRQLKWWKHNLTRAERIEYDNLLETLDIEDEMLSKLVDFFRKEYDK